jgi:hypothetical protein
MPLSHKARQDAANLDLEIAKSISQDVNDAINSVRESSDVLRHVDRDLVRGYLTREVAIDPGAADAWNGRGERPEHWQAVTQRAARKLEAAVERLHGDGTGDDDGVDEETVAENRRLAREIAGMDGKVASSLIEAAFAAASQSDANFARAYDGRASDPAAWNGALRHVAFRTREVIDGLAKATRPTPGMPEGVDGLDLAQMSEKDWQNYMRRAKAQGGGK